MFNLINKYIEAYYPLIVMGIVAYLILKAFYLEYKLEKTESEKIALSYKLAQETRNNITLKNSLEVQNKALEKIEVDYNNKIKEFENFKPQIKYIEVKSDECKDIKLIIDDIRNSSF
ncbi:hypothetical protein ACOL28_03675 [Aliarcobacter butzleri]